MLSVHQINRQLTCLFARTGRLLCLCLCVLLAGPAFAQQEEQVTEEASTSTATVPLTIYMDAPEIFLAGEEPVFSAPAAVLDPEADPEFSTRAASIADYTERVAQIESQGGAWDANLIESLATLSDLQQRQGDYPAAIDSLNRALHISRINNGLNTTAQIEVVQQLIASHLALEDWNSADLYHNYLFYIQQKAYGSSDPRLIPDLVRLGDWHIEAFNRGVGDPLGLRLSTANILYQAAARLLAEFDSTNVSRFVSYQHRIAKTAFLIARNAELMTEIDRTQFRNQQGQLRDMLNVNSVMLPGGFRSGEQALLDIISVYIGSGNTVALAEAYIQLGDWYLLSERRRRAEEQYAVAWKLLVPPEENEEEDQQPPVQQPAEFSRIRIIPAYVQHDRWLSRPGLERPAISSLQWAEVDLSFTVTRNGLVRDIEILSEESVENAGHFARVSRELRRYRFRPLIVDGEMVESPDNQVRVRYWY